jgi:NAD(P)-dependent dehydrogenase (short-subunit alcohol dehydrogenase family)
MSIELNPEFWGKGMKHCIIIGINSDIAKELKVRLERDGWTVNGTCRNKNMIPNDRWDLCIVCQGTMEPIGHFFDCEQFDFEYSVAVNAMWPLTILRKIWLNRKYGAAVCFLGGPNLSKPSPTYTAYRAGKALLDSLCTTLNAEYPENNFFMLNPGVVRTKIHYQTLAAGERAANLERVRGIVEGSVQTNSHDEVYRRLMLEVNVNPFPLNEGT